LTTGGTEGRREKSTKKSLLLRFFLSFHVFSVAHVAGRTHSVHDVVEEELAVCPAPS
jgi:hypothetical protein